MELIFGGAYQGKLEYVKETFNISEDEIFYCHNVLENKDAEFMEKPEIDFSKKVVYKLEYFILACVKQGIEAKDYLEEHLDELIDKIIICTDISQGVVPMDKQVRGWREMNGRTMIYLSNHADNVTRIFCGLPQKLKDSKIIENKGGVSAKSYIHLIRHGTTEGNVKRWYYGNADIPLIEEGRELIGKLAKEGIYPQNEDTDFYTSGLIRTEQTFNIIFGEKEHGIIENMKEMCFGDYEKHSYEDLKENVEYQQWISDKTGSLAPPNGESPNSFRARVSKGFKELMGLHKLKEFSVRHAGKAANSLIVCHGGVISAVMAECFPQEEKHFYDWIPDPGHGYTIEIDSGKPKNYTRF